MLAQTTNPVTKKKNSAAPQDKWYKQMSLDYYLSYRVRMIDECLVFFSLFYWFKVGVEPVVVICLYKF